MNTIQKATMAMVLATFSVGSVYAQSSGDGGGAGAAGGARPPRR